MLVRVIYILMLLIFGVMLYVNPAPGWKNFFRQVLLLMIAGILVVADSRHPSALVKVVYAVVQIVLLVLLMCIQVRFMRAATGNRRPDSSD